MHHSREVCCHGRYLRFLPQPLLQSKLLKVVY